MEKQQFEEITIWQDKTFPQSTELSRLKHLEQEIKELIFDAENDAEGKPFEYADCFILLFGAAKKAGYSYDEICGHIEAKFDVNKKRKWGTPDKDGVVNHLK